MTAGLNMAAGLLVVLALAGVLALVAPEISARRLGRGSAAEAPNAARTPAGGCRPWVGRCSPAARPGSTGEVPTGA